jgi:SHS2 domain-containing protein
MSFRFLEHTADVQVECRAQSFEELLETAAGALYALALKEVRAQTDAERVIDIPGNGHEDVLVRWLQELIFHLDTDRFVATSFAFETKDNRMLWARLRGYVCAPEDRAVEVKSATYHELDVRRTDDGFVARVILDL